MTSQIIVFQQILLVLFVLLVQFCNANKLSLFNTFKSIINEQGDGTTWAVLVAGSNGYYNYRHQADVCHAYQILKNGGLKDDNIIVFMYDDIANDPRNPRKGVLINRPEGPDVYAGVPKDYTGDSVTKENFFNVLLGNKNAVRGGSGKVVASSFDDNVFVYYSGHGSSGLLGMPNLPCIFADDFIQVLKAKYASETYNEMVIYLESCESGSMFEGLLPEDLDIYVTTSANAHENSYAAYCPHIILPPRAEFYTCLGDLYSISWMENSESEDLTRETLQQQYLKVSERTNSRWFSRGSHVMQYGSLWISGDSVSDFQGSASTPISPDRFPKFDPMGVIDQRDADLYSMRQRYKNSKVDTPHEKEELLKKIKEIEAHRAHLDSSVSMIRHDLLGSRHGPVRREGLALVDDWGCLKSMVRTFERHCGSLTQYGMKHTRTFADLCNSGVTNKAMDVAAKKTCRSFRMGQWDPEIVGYSS